MKAWLSRNSPRGQFRNETIAKPLCSIINSITLKRIIPLILTVFILSSCYDGAKYVKLNDGKNHLIDLGRFSIVTPTDFKYKKQNGTDSFNGEIRNWKFTTFFFDYGWYSPKPPMTKEQFIDDNRDYLNFESTQMFFNLIELKPYENDEGSINPRDITKKIKNVVLNKMNDSIVLSRGKQKNCAYYHTFNFENKEYKIPFCIPQENLDNFKYYEIKTDTIDNYQRTISIWKNKNMKKYSSVNLVPLNDDPYKMELWVGINTNGKLKIEKIREILESVKLKNN